MLPQLFKIRQPSELPFYCRPLYLFIAVWLMMLATFQLYISYTSYPDISLALMIFAGSLASFLIGYGTVRSASFALDYPPPNQHFYQIDISKLRRFHLLLFFISISILILNLKLHGLPPIFGFFGGDVLDYQEYGSLRQVLYPAIMAMLVSASLEPSKIRRWSLYAFGPICALSYASRGYLLIMLVQLLMVFSLRTRLRKIKLYALALSALAMALILSDLIGNGRNSFGSAALLGYMQIKRAYYDWPTAYLWLIAYVSSPISNFCWIVRVYHYDHPTASLFSTMLPGFWTPNAKELDLGSQNIVDGVHTYMAKYYLNLWFFGIFIINYVWGLISGHLSVGDRLTRNFLTSAVLLGCMSFIFFEDFLTMLILVLELILLSRVQRYFTWSSKPVFAP